MAETDYYEDVDECDPDAKLGSDDSSSETHDGMTSEEEEQEVERKGKRTFGSAFQDILGNEPQGQKTLLAKAENRLDLLKRRHMEREKEHRLLAQKRKELANQNHVIPDYSTENAEKMLAKIARRGVVRLFNAVAKAQKPAETDKASQKSKLKADTMSKTSFLDMLKGPQQTDAKTTSSLQKAEATAKPGWDALQDNFLIGAKMKDWDKEIENEENSEQEVESEGDEA